MWRRTGRAVGWALLAVFMLPATAGPDYGTEDVEVIELTTRPGQRDDAAITYPLAVLDSAGWGRDRILRAVHEVEDIFGQCGVVVTAEPVYRLKAPSRYRKLDPFMQARILSRLPSTRPIALLVDQTTDRDVAYSYLDSAPTASRGSAWVTRNGHPACTGVLLAHELGHILLNSARHSDDPDNLMSHTCTVSNVAGFRPVARLSGSQCDQLRAW